MKYCSPRYNTLLQRWERLGKGLVHQSEARRSTVEQRIRKIDSMIAPLKEVTDCQNKDITDGQYKLEESLTKMQKYVEQYSEVTKAKISKIKDTCQNEVDRIISQQKEKEKVLNSRIADRQNESRKKFRQEMQESAEPVEERLGYMKQNIREFRNALAEETNNRQHHMKLMAKAMEKQLNEYQEELVSQITFRKEAGKVISEGMEKTITELETLLNAEKESRSESMVSILDTLQNMCCRMETSL